jgi:hypothetical protein
VGAAPEVLRHPDPLFSVEELRWEDVQRLQAGQQPAAYASTSHPLTPAAATSAAGPPGTPVFPTPVRTLFPGTPAETSGTASASGLLGMPSTALGSSAPAGLGSFAAFASTGLVGLSADDMDTGVLPEDDTAKFM